MEKEEFLKQVGRFLLKANEVGYAAGNETNIIGEPDGSKTIIFEEGDWRFHDNYFGGEPYGGREVVFYKGKPIWIMVYYGRVIGPHSTKGVYELLRKALMACPEEFPVRGPIEPYLLSELSAYRFILDFESTLERFGGVERISIGSEYVYEAKITGGLVNQ